MIKFKKKDFIYLISREIKMLPLVGFSLVFRLLPNLWIILLLSSFFGHWSLDRIQKFWNLLVDDSKIPNKPMPGLCWNCSVQGNVPFLFSFFFFFSVKVKRVSCGIARGHQRESDLESYAFYKFPVLPVYALLSCLQVADLCLFLHPLRAVDCANLALESMYTGEFACPREQFFFVF